MGRDAMVSCIMKNLHPSKVLRDAFKNLPMGHRLGGLTVKRMEKKKINLKDQLAIIVTHNDIKDLEGNLIELHASKRWFVVTKEGPVDYFFDVVDEAGRTGDDTNNESSNVYIPEDVRMTAPRGNSLND